MRLSKSTTFPSKLKEIAINNRWKRNLPIMPLEDRNQTIQSVRRYLYQSGQHIHYRIG